MLSEPPLSFGKQLFQFVRPDEIVLAVVENRNEHVQVTEQFGQPFSAANGHRKIRTVAPFWEVLVKRLANCLDRVAQRLEDSLQEVLTATDQQYFDLSRKRNRRCS